MASRVLLAILPHRPGGDGAPPSIGDSIQLYVMTAFVMTAPMVASETVC